MQPLVVDGAFETMLEGVVEPVALLGKNGKHLGHFVPDCSVDAKAYNWARSTTGIDELKRRAAMPGSLSTEEALRRLAASQ